MRPRRRVVALPPDRPRSGTDRARPGARRRRPSIALRPRRRHRRPGSRRLPPRGAAAAAGRRERRRRFSWLARSSSRRPVGHCLARRSRKTTAMGTDRARPSAECAWTSGENQSSASTAAGRSGSSSILSRRSSADSIRAAGPSSSASSTTCGRLRATRSMMDSAVAGELMSQVPWPGPGGRGPWWWICPRTPAACSR